MQDDAGLAVVVIRLGPGPESLWGFRCMRALVRSLGGLAVLAMSIKTREDRGQACDKLIKGGQGAAGTGTGTGNGPWTRPSNRCAHEAAGS